MAVAGSHHLRQRDFVHLADIKPRSNAYIAWEHRRHRQAHWLVECAAEFVSLLYLLEAAIKGLMGCRNRWVSSFTSSLVGPLRAAMEIED